MALAGRFPPCFQGSADGQEVACEDSAWPRGRVAWTVLTAQGWGLLAHAAVSALGLCHVSLDVPAPGSWRQRPAAAAFEEPAFPGAPVSAEVLWASCSALSTASSPSPWRPAVPASLVVLSHQAQRQQRPAVAEPGARVHGAAVGALPSPEQCASARPEPASHSCPSGVTTDTWGTGHQIDQQLEKEAAAQMGGLWWY